MSTGKTLLDHGSVSTSSKSKLINGSTTGSTNGYGDLEDYIIELQSRSQSNGTSSENDKNSINVSSSVSSSVNANGGVVNDLDPTELLLQLAQKEKDLILAAELGKALLERNEQLTRANERITEEYSHKLECNLVQLSLSTCIVNRYIQNVIVLPGTRLILLACSWLITKVTMGTKMTKMTKMTKYIYYQKLAKGMTSIHDSRLCLLSFSSLLLHQS